ncbi:tetratricopeptide repeat protein [Lacticaseibacillus thailandensis]|uniref:TPR repeats containing protein n=1 Tax=Lacticaseibacillus thailandensis DSM 22698 = JCM 13996 TaxID=1423810 RepID=A0A0R2C8T3_9LACO|nr:tetratricopeptide repeat protein [Lacticaseibacillus thailandensis]KRM87991.1 tPR repeats containing protein [Lacticaseibacillus thailandensis DSM 22698 = JCM 13996]
MTQTDDAITQFNHGHQEEGIQAAVHDIDAHPHDPQRYSVLATMLITVRAYDQATTLITRALGLFPDNPELRYSWGLLAYAQQDLQDALARLLPLTDVHADVPMSLRGDAAYMVALCYNDLGQSARALAFAMTAHDVNPRAHDAVILMANILLALGEFNSAVDTLAPLINAHDPQIDFAYGMALSAAGRDGSKYLDAARKADPALFADQRGKVKDIARFLQLRHADDETEGHQDA